MSDINWEGGAPAIAQVIDFTPANVEVGDVFTITLRDDADDSYQITFTATATTVANVVTGLYDAAVIATAAGHGPWGSVTAADNTTKLTITADTAGTPFWYTTTAVDGGGADTQTLTASVATASSGPNDYNVAANYSGGAVPGTADNLRIPKWATDGILYGLDGDYAGTEHLLKSFTMDDGCSIAIGNKEKSLYLDIDAGGMKLAGTGQIFIKVKEDPGATVRITEAGATAGGSPGCNLVGVIDQSISIKIASGQSVGLGVDATTRVTDVQMDGGGELRIGTLLTKSTGTPSLELLSGTAYTESALTTITSYGTLYREAGTVTTLYVYAGTCYNNSADAPTTIVVGQATFIMGPHAAQPTTFQIYGKNWNISDIHGTITNDWDFYQCSPGDGRLTLAKHKRWTPTAIT